MAIKVLALASGVTGLADHRVLNGSMMTPAGQLQVRSGVLPGSGGFDLSTVSAMVARVAPGKALIANGVSSSLGPYLLVSDANVDITFDAGEASVARVDRIIARAYDNTNDGSGDTKGDVYYLKGQASGAATALPTNSVLLYEMTIPAGASAGSGGVNFGNAVDQRSYTAAQGGIFPVASNTQMAAISSPHEGMTCYRTDLDVLYVYDGTTWRARGVANVASSANLTSINNAYDGQLATVRDTDYTYQYTGSTWKRVTADFNSQATVAVSENTNDTTTSTTYTAGTSCGTSFVAPTSGSVEIHWTGWIGSNSTTVSGATRGAFLSARVGTGSTVGAGTQIVAADDEWAVFYGNQSTSSGFKYIGAGTFITVTGLTAGSTYNVQLRFRSCNSADTAAQHHRRVMVKPVY